MCNIYKDIYETLPQGKTLKSTILTENITLAGIDPFVQLFVNHVTSLHDPSLMINQMIYSNREISPTLKNHRQCIKTSFTTSFLLFFLTIFNLLTYKSVLCINFKR